MAFSAAELSDSENRAQGQREMDRAKVQRKSLWEVIKPHD